MLNRTIQLISFFFFGLALWLIIKEIDRVGWHHLVQTVLSTPLWVIGLASIFVVLNFFILTGYDLLALDYIRQKIPFQTVLKTACIGFAVSNTVGHSFVSGGAVRFLFYQPLGVSRSHILLLIAFETLTIFMGMGFAYIVAVGLTFGMPDIAEHFHFDGLYGATCLILITFILYYVFIVLQKRKFRIGGIVLSAPTSKMTLAQLTIGFLDNFLLSLVFYSVFRYYIETPFLPVFVIFTIAQITGQISQVPGGLGVLASFFILLFPHTSDEKAGILSALFIFRILYFFVPFLLASCFLGMQFLIKRFLSVKNSENM